MKKMAAKTAVRKPRADAQRNREQILKVAKTAFTRSGESISMDDVAKRAGIGAGTLYRHFANRDALLAAVYRNEVEKLAAAEKTLAATLAPTEALRAWMLLFVDYIATKQIIAPALNAMVGGPAKLFDSSGQMIKDAIASLTKRAVESGNIRDDLEPLDLLRALVGVSNVASGAGWVESAKRLVDILMLGSRPMPKPSSKKR